MAKSSSSPGKRQMGSFEGKWLIFTWIFFHQSRFGHIFVDLFCKQVLQLPSMYWFFLIIKSYREKHLL